MVRTVAMLSRRYRKKRRAITKKTITTIPPRISGNSISRVFTNVIDYANINTASAGDLTPGLLSARSFFLDELLAGCNEWTTQTANYKYIKVMSLKIIIYRNNISGGNGAALPAQAMPCIIGYECSGAVLGAKTNNYVLGLPYSKIGARDIEYF